MSIWKFVLASLKNLRKLTLYLLGSLILLEVCASAQTISITAVNRRFFSQPQAKSRYACYFNRAKKKSVVGKLSTSRIFVGRSKWQIEVEDRRKKNVIPSAIKAACNKFKPAESPTLPTPTAAPTVAPSATPSATSTSVPTSTPTATPTSMPSATPTATPTATSTAVPTIALNGVDIAAVIEPYNGGFLLRWTNPSDGGTYSLSLKNGSQVLYYGGHYSGSAVVDYNQFNLNGNEILRGSFIHYNAQGQWVKNSTVFEVDLQTLISRRYNPRLIPFNPTTSNALLEYFTGDYTDSDHDGMTDLAEVKYGFNPNDAASFPQEPSLIEPNTVNIGPVTMTLEARGPKYNFNWKNPASGSGYSLTVRHGSTTLMHGGHYAESATLNLITSGLTGSETLQVTVTEYSSTGQFIASFPETDVSLSAFPKPPLGDVTNKIGYFFSADFPDDRKQEYRRFLRRLWPLLERYLGPPAESFNTEIRNMGPNSDYFMIIEDGRVFLSDTSFIPRLIAHEFIHAWKGAYTITSNSQWEYDPLLSGFEEGSAEGLAFILMQEYVRSYPDDEASVQLLNWKPYQYYSHRGHAHDTNMFTRMLGAGPFWLYDGGMTRERYSSSASAFQMICKKREFFMRDFLADYYARINSDPSWRSNRTDIVDLWHDLVPTVNGVDLKKWLNAHPVFNGRVLDAGLYLLGTGRAYGQIGDQSLGLAYAFPATIASVKGDFWAVPDGTAYLLPAWVPTFDRNDAWTYTDFGAVPFSVFVKAANTTVLSFTGNLSGERATDGGPVGHGFIMLDELRHEEFEQGLYSADITFDTLIGLDPGASERRFFFGIKDLNQNKDSEYMIMVGHQGVPAGSGTVRLQLSGIDVTANVVNGAAVFRSLEWPWDLEGIATITVTSTTGVSRQYERTVLQAGTNHQYYQHQFVIVDEDFNGIEDWVEQPDISPLIAEASLEEASSSTVSKKPNEGFLK